MDPHNTEMLRIAHDDWFLRRHDPFCEVNFEVSPKSSYVHYEISPEGDPILVPRKLFIPDPVVVVIERCTVRVGHRYVEIAMAAQDTDFDQWPELQTLLWSRIVIPNI